MKLTMEPFVCLNDIEGFYAYASGNPQSEQINVSTIRVGYPVADWSVEEVKSFQTLDGKPAMSTIALLLEINRVVVEELAKGNNYAPHCAEDYCIEHITVMDGVATVEFGS